MADIILRIYKLIQMGCLDGARFFVCDTEPSDLTRHASNADETFLLDKINGDVKSADTTHVDHIIKRTSQNVILVGTFGGLTLNRQQVCSTSGARGCHARPICLFNCLLAIKYRRLFLHHFN